MLPLNKKIRFVHFKLYNPHCPYTSMCTWRWDGCYAIHPVEGASQGQMLPQSHPVVIQFPSNLFSATLLELSIPVPRRGNIINISVILHQFTAATQKVPPLSQNIIIILIQSSFCFPGLAWTVGYTIRHWAYELPGDGQKYGRNECRVQTEGFQWIHSPTCSHTFCRLLSFAPVCLVCRSL